MKITERQYQMAAALSNFWPVVYPEIKQIAYGPLMLAKVNEHLAPWKCKFVYTLKYEDGDFVFESDEARVLFLLRWGGEQ
jgi:hypothetical protein